MNMLPPPPAMPAASATSTSAMTTPKLLAKHRTSMEGKLKTKRQHLDSGVAWKKMSFTLLFFTLHQRLCAMIFLPANRAKIFVSAVNSGLWQKNVRQGRQIFSTQAIFFFVVTSRCEHVNSCIFNQHSPWRRFNALNALVYVANTHPWS